MKKAFLLLAPLALAFGCSKDTTSETRAAERGTSPTTTTTTPPSNAGKNMPSGTAGTQTTTPAGTAAGAQTPAGTAGQAGSAAKPAGSATNQAGTTNANKVPAPDNTDINERDRSGDTLTPPDQKENETDLALTQKIRQALVDDDALSVSAQNVKIISQNGTVTLRGPVKDQSEKDSIESKAKAVAGVDKVDNQLEVKGP
jgi:osmotically-inducible protein OsmY